MTTGERLVFAGGAPRSGLTLLRALVNAHPRIFSGPDHGTLPGLPLQWRDFAANLGELHAQAFGLSAQTVRENFAQVLSALIDQSPAAKASDLVVEKSAMNVLIFEDLAALFPDAKFIHVIRDGRDVAASLLARNWTDPRSGAPLPHVADAAAAARYWNGLASLGLKAQQTIGDDKRFYVLRYEGLVTRPKRTLRELFAFLGVPFDAAVFDFHKQDTPLIGTERDSAALLRQPITGARVGRWRKALSEPQRQSVETLCAPMLKAFRYA